MTPQTPQPVPALKRPKLLVKAARIGLEHYNRAKDLVRIASLNRLPEEGKAMPALIELETELNAARKTKATDYSLQTHIAVLTALIDEMRWVKSAG